MFYLRVCIIGGHVWLLPSRLQNLRVLNWSGIVVPPDPFPAAPDLFPVQGLVKGLARLVVVVRWGF